MSDKTVRIKGVDEFLLGYLDSIDRRLEDIDSKLDTHITECSEQKSIVSKHGNDIKWIVRVGSSIGAFITGTIVYIFTGQVR